LAVLFSLSYAHAQNDNNNPKSLYNECVSVSGKSLCDFLFKKDGANTNNYTDIVQSNYTDLTNSTDLSNLTYSTYNDNDLGFSIQHPSDWRIDTKQTQFNTVVGFYSPDNVAEVDVRIFPKGDYKSIRDYGDKNFKQSNEQTLLAYYRNSSTLLSGKPAFKAIYLTTYNPSMFENAFGYKSSTSKAIMTGTMVLDKKSIYAIAYFANSADFDNYRPVVENMINSFKIYGKGPVIQEDNSSSSGG